MRRQRQPGPRRKGHRQPVPPPPLASGIHESVSHGTPKRAVVRPKACECDAAGPWKPQGGSLRCRRLARPGARQASPPGQHVGWRVGSAWPGGCSSADAGLAWPGGRDRGGMGWAGATMAGPTGRSRGMCREARNSYNQSTAWVRRLREAAWRWTHSLFLYQEQRLVLGPAQSRGASAMRSRETRNTRRLRSCETTASTMKTARGLSMWSAALLLWPHATASPTAVHRRLRGQSGADAGTSARVAENDTQIFCHNEVRTQTPRLPSASPLCLSPCIHGRPLPCGRES